MSIGADALPVDSRVGYQGPVSKTLAPSGTGNVLTNVAETGMYDPVAPDDAAGHGSGPCRKLVVTGNGNIIFTLWHDDTATAGLKRTIAVTAGQVISDYLIRKVWLTGTTATFDALG